MRNSVAQLLMFDHIWGVLTLRWWCDGGFTGLAQDIGDEAGRSVRDHVNSETQRKVRMARAIEVAEVKFAEDACA